MSLRTKKQIRLLVYLRTQWSKILLKTKICEDGGQNTATRGRRQDDNLFVINGEEFEITSTNCISALERGKVLPKISGQLN